MVILSLNTIDSSGAYKQIPIYRIINPDRFLMVCRGYLFVFCVAFIPLRTVEDAGPYKEKSNILMRTSLSRELITGKVFCISYEYILATLRYASSTCAGVYWLVDVIDAS